MLMKLWTKKKKFELRWTIIFDKTRAWMALNYIFLKYIVNLSWSITSVIWSWNFWQIIFWIFRSRPSTCHMCICWLIHYFVGNFVDWFNIIIVLVIVFFLPCRLTLWQNIQAVRAYTWMAAWNRWRTWSLASKLIH